MVIEEAVEYLPQTDRQRTDGQRTDRMYQHGTAASADTVDIFGTN